MRNESIEWQLFPKNLTCPNHLSKIVDVFSLHIEDISSRKYKYGSDDVLFKLSTDLISIGYKVEQSKKAKDKISVPVLFGKNGRLEKFFDADAYSFIDKTVIEIEAGRALTNYQFLKDLFEACVMSDVDYCVIAVRQIYRKSKDYDKIIQFFETLFASNKLTLPLKGVLVLGY